MDRNIAIYNLRFSFRVCNREVMEMRLIDADELKEQLEQRYMKAVEWGKKTNYPKRAEGAIAAYLEAVRTLNNAPTVDAVPEREAEWIEIKGGMKYRCSDCNGDVFYKTRYCPRCGAKMG